MIRCHLCFGRGYRGRWRHGKNGVKRWSIEACRTCCGSGQVLELRGRRPGPELKVKR